MTHDYASLRETFRPDGFVRVEKFLEPREVDDVEAHLAHFIREIVPGLPKTQAMYQDYGNPETLKQIVQLEVDPFFAAFQTSAKVQGLAEALLQQSVIATSIQFFNKPPRIGTATPPHQDGYYFCLVPNEALTVWIALDEITEENGAMRYWKGSHQKGVVPHDASHVLGFSQGLKAGETDNLGVETICNVQRGDALIHHSLMIHAAGPNRSHRTRRALGLIYYGENAKVDAEAYHRYQESLAVQRKDLTT